MPTYEYRCESCEREWEEEQRISDPTTEHCHQCGGNNIRRLISNGGGFVLRGSLWSRDNYGLK